MKDLAPQTAALRPPHEVMRLARMGAMMPTRLSFLRTLIRRLCAEGAQIERTHWQMSASGYGRAVYSIPLAGHTYSLVAISNDLPDAQRSDRVIATAWDAAFVLFDGVPGQADIDRIAQQAPKQEAGRFDPRDLVLSRANKSVRMWEATVAALKSGTQPDARMIRDIGYLMRTTAVYGNGKFGIADRHLIADRTLRHAAKAGPVVKTFQILNIEMHCTALCADTCKMSHETRGNPTTSCGDSRPAPGFRRKTPSRSANIS